MLVASMVSAVVVCGITARILLRVVCVSVQKRAFRGEYCADPVVACWVDGCYVALRADDFLESTNLAAVLD
jgi:hypothetical protein